MATPAPIDPAQLRPHYSAFLGGVSRILLTGHSHQAWPDVAREGVIACWDDAARHVDDKWEQAFAMAERVRRGVACRIGAAPGEVALGANTHELVARFLSALPLRKRRHLVTTSGEFHSLDRQMRALAEAGVEVTFVSASPVDTLAERLSAAVRADTAALLASTVLFQSSTVVPHLQLAVQHARERGAQVLLDAYHAFNVMPFCVSDFTDPVFIVGGGYKYAQWGEGACFLRVPPGTELRPAFTGWYSDFENLDAQRDTLKIGYGRRPAERFAGSTYDPTSHYRAARVIQFFEEQGLDVPRLRACSLRQTSQILSGLDGYEVGTPREAAGRAGFVSVRCRKAPSVARELGERGVRVDARGEWVRFGPAPYTTSDEIDTAIGLFREIAPPR